MHLEDEQTRNKREDLLKSLADLTEKIKTNEDFPDGPQTYSSLVDIDDRIEECLNCWYY